MIKEHKSTIQYRPHIDGLRGIAIIAVLLYHAKLSNIHGGYVGVDVFFVISGFLITSIILRELNAGSFSLIEFWERRVRRIVPALFLMVITTVVAAHYIIRYPEDYRHLGNAVISQSLFASNMFFVLSDNYFDQPSKYSPLLHTWTLSVEEQFYIFFPVIILFCLWLFRRKGITSILSRVKLYSRDRVLVLALALISAISFVVNIWLVNIHPDFGWSLPFMSDRIFETATYGGAGFYLLPSRAWELCLGGVIALCSIKIRSAVFSEIMSISGLLAIFCAMFLYNDKTPFPGFAAVLPVIGALLFIIANDTRRTFSSKLLSFTPLVWIGLISYSLYLWHWPIFVFARILFPQSLTPPTMWMLIVLAVGISYLSFRFIETPILKKIYFPTRKSVFISAAIALLTIAASGFLLVRSQFRESTPALASEILQVQGENSARDGMCFPLHDETGEYSGLCHIGDSRLTKADFVLWGDSHADADVPLFSEMGWRYGVEGAVFSKADCAPVVGILQESPAPLCILHNALALEYIKEKNIKNIYLVARWSNYIMESDKMVSVAFRNTKGGAPKSHEESSESLQIYLSQMVKDLTREGRNVYIVKQAPEQFDYVPRTTFYRALDANYGFDIPAAREEDNATYQSLANNAIDSLRGTKGVHIIDPSKQLCHSGKSCDIIRNEYLLYRDENHLSIAGVMSLEPLFQPSFTQMRHVVRE